MDACLQLQDAAPLRDGLEIWRAVHVGLCRVASARSLQDSVSEPYSPLPLVPRK